MSRVLFAMMTYRPRLARLFLPLCALFALLPACKPVEKLHSGPVRQQEPELRFVSGDTLRGGDLRFSMPMRPARPEIVFEGRRIPPDTLSGFRLGTGANFEVISARIYLQTMSGRIDGYRRVIRYPFHSDSSGNSGSAQLSLLQKAPGAGLYRPYDNILVNLVCDNPASRSLAVEHRKAWRRAQISFGVGTALAIAGGLGMMMTAFVSDMETSAGRPYYLASAAGVAVGALSLSVPFAIFNNHSRHYRNAALNRYNAQ